jgi:DNA-binding transcriptional regulator LsrR (DeoR family)
MQEILADFLGLTAIHVNRTLAQLCRDHLVKIASGVLEVENLDRLRAVVHSEI